MQSQVSIPAREWAPWIRRAARTIAWGGLTLCGFLASFVVVGFLMSQIEHVLGLSHAVMLGLWAIGWVPVAGLLALGAVRVAFGTWPQVRTLAWFVLLLGAVVSAAHMWVLADWAIGRFGYSDPDYMGPTFMLFGVVAGAAVAAFGTWLVPRRAAWLPLLVVAGTLALSGFVILWNIPGLKNGLAADSGPLAAATVAAGLYIAAVGILSVARLVRR